MKPSIEFDIQLTPNDRWTNRSVVCIRVENLGGRTVEAIAVSVCPQSSPVGVWLRNGEEGESGHSKGKLRSKQVEHGLS